MVARRILVAYIIIIAVAGLTIGALKIIRPTQSTATVNGPKASGVLDVFIKQASKTEQLKGLGVGLSTRVQPIMYFLKSDPPNTYIGLTGGHAASISGTTPLTQTALATIEKGVTNDFQRQGLDKQATPNLPSVLALYQASDTYCTLLGSPGATQLNVVCADKAEYNDTLVSTQSILKKWNGLSSANYTYTTSQIVMSDNGSHQLAYIVLMNGTTHIPAAKLVYTKSENDSWQYVTNLTDSNNTPNGGGKLVQTPQVEKIMNDPNYGPLLMKVLGTTDPRR